MYSRLAVMVISSLLLTTETFAREFHFKDIHPDDMKLVFRGEAFDLTLVRSQSGQSPNYRQELEYQQWSSNSRFVTVVVDRYIEFGYHFVDVFEFEEFAEGYFPNIRGTSISWGKKHRENGPLGETVIQSFTSNGRHCLVWRSLFESASVTGKPNAILVGCLCQRGPLSDDLAEQLISAAGFKGEYLPPSADRLTAKKPNQPAGRRFRHQRIAPIRTVYRFRSPPTGREPTICFLAR